jgi:hypothetical protein
MKVSILEQIEAIGPGDWTDHEDWESTDWARGMSAEIRMTAKLLAREIEVDRLERMMQLPAGQIDSWWREDEEFQRAARASYWEQRERAARPDPTKVLTPKQLKAAEAYFVEGSSQQGAAEAAGVTDRTVRTWLKDPVFTHYGEQLRSRRAERIAREREALENRASVRYLAQVERALDVLDVGLEIGDPDVALAVARPYMKRLAEGERGRMRK